MRHVLGSLGVFISILFLPYWIYLPILLIAIIFIPFFWEGILFGSLIDILYGSGYSGVLSLFSSFSFYTLSALLVVLPLQARLRFHA